MRASTLDGWVCFSSVGRAQKCTSAVLIVAALTRLRLTLIQEMLQRRNKAAAAELCVNLGGCLDAAWTRPAVRVCFGVMGHRLSDGLQRFLPAYQHLRNPVLPACTGRTATTP